MTDLVKENANLKSRLEKTEADLLRLKELMYENGSFKFNELFRRAEAAEERVQTLEDEISELRANDDYLSRIQAIVNEAADGDVKKLRALIGSLHQVLLYFEDQMEPEFSAKILSITQSIRDGETVVPFDGEIEPFKFVDSYNLVDHLIRQREFSLLTFGPGERSGMNIKHIRKELVEIEEDPFNIVEWIDVVLLALDGAMRHGATPVEVCDALRSKLAKNMQRDWPDWRTSDKDAPIEHKRGKHD